MDALRESNEIAELNGVHLNKAIRESMDKTSRRSSVFPAPEIDDIGLDVLHVNEAMSVRSDRDQIFKVVQGEGRIMIGENIQVRLQPQDSFPLPGGIEASVVSNGMVLFGFY
jgi:mannose-6-phosphate isomerase-like protein (cupin superfamily)